MKKLILILIPLCIILALFSIANNKNYTFIDILNEVKNINWKNLDIEAIEKAWNLMNFNPVWNKVGEAWNNIDGIDFLQDIFEALGTTIYALGESVAQIGQMMYYTTTFIIQALEYFILNLIELIKVVKNYIQ